MSNVSINCNANIRLNKLLQQINTNVNNVNSSKRLHLQTSNNNNIKYSDLVSHPSSLPSLRNKTVFITGGSRGIGLAIALKCASYNCNIIIASKTSQLHPKLPGTLYTAAKQLHDCGAANVLPIICDIRSEIDILSGINKLKNVSWFNNCIDVLINNASAINILSTELQSIKQYDLINNINVRGTYMITKYLIKYLKNSSNAHILTISPPLYGSYLNNKWLFNGNYLSYTISKYTQSMYSLGWSSEFKKYNIGCNTLWPKTLISTTAIKNILGSNYAINKCRTPNIMADAAHLIIIQNSKTFTGNFIIDEDILRCIGVNDFNKYKVNPNIKDKDLIPDYLLPNQTN